MITKKQLKQRIKAWLIITMLGISMTIGFNLVSPYFNQRSPQPSDPKSIKISPLPGHWLKTREGETTRQEEQEKREKTEKPEEKSTQSEISKSDLALAIMKDLPELANNSLIVETTQKPLELQKMQGVFNNKKLANKNVMLFWTDGPELKALTVMSINNETKKGAVIAIPLFTKIIHDGSFTTVGQLFKAEGKNSVIKIAEEYLDVSIQSYVSMDQSSFEKVSELLGPIQLEDGVVPVAEAFEQTRSGQRKDDQAVVRAVAKRVFTPEMLVKLPKLVWILSTEVKTNLGSDEILAIYRMTKNTDTGQMRKMALPGETYNQAGLKYRDVPDHVWKNILWELTTN